MAPDTACVKSQNRLESHDQQLLRRRLYYMGFSVREGLMTHSRILLAVGLLCVARQVGAQATHTLKPTPKTVAWGYYDAKAAPVLRVKSGDTVEIQTLITNSPKRLED